jgi:hypothetical protein
MKLNVSALLISVIVIVFLFANDIYPYNFALFLIFQVTALSFLRNKVKEQYIMKLEARIRKLEIQMEEIIHKLAE